MLGLIVRPPARSRICTLSLHDALPILWLEFHLSKNDILKLYLDRAYMGGGAFGAAAAADYYFGKSDRKSTRLNSSHLVISYAVFCLEKKMVVGPIGPVPAYGQPDRVAQ